MKRVLILILALSTLVAARDKKPKVHPGPYVFSSKSSAQTLKALIVQENLREGYTLDSDNQLQFRFSQPAQMPPVDAIFTASSVCKGMTTKKVWLYALAELNGTTKVTVQPLWEYPDDYCQIQTQGFIWSRPEEMAAFQAMLDKAPTSAAQAPTATPAPTPVAYQPPAEPAKPSTAQPASPVESSEVASEDAARRAKQHAACLELAKDNPSIICK
ncbi:MAG: hypothetical protein WCF61_03415 [Terriglobales bacterium]